MCSVRPPEIVAALLADDLPHERPVHQRSARAASRRGRSRRARSRRGRRAGRSACRAGRAAAPAGSSARRSAPRCPCPRSRRARRRRRSRSGSAPPRAARGRSAARPPAGWRSTRRRAAARGLTVTTSAGFVRSTRHEHGHQLRDARDRHALAGVAARPAPRRSRRSRPRTRAPVTCGGAASTGAASARAAAAKRRPFKRAAVYVYFTRTRWPTIRFVGSIPGSAPAAARRSCRT